MRQIWTLFSLLIALLSAAPLFAQSGFDIDDIIPDLTAEERGKLADQFGIYTNGLVVFSGINAMSSGSFTFEGGESTSDADLNLLRLPFSYTFGEDGETWRPVVRGVFGHFTSTASVSGFSDAIKEVEGELPPSCRRFRIGRISGATRRRA